CTIGWKHELRSSTRSRGNSPPRSRTTCVYARVASKPCCGNLHVAGSARGSPLDGSAASRYRWNGGSPGVGCLRSKRPCAIHCLGSTAGSVRKVSSPSSQPPGGADGHRTSSGICLCSSRGCARRRQVEICSPPTLSRECLYDSDPWFYRWPRDPCLGTLQHGEW